MWGWRAEGLFTAFALLSFLPYGARAAMGLGSVCCRFCPSSVLQKLATALVGPAALEYWHTCVILVLISWLVVGGVLMKGGRGWCLFFCPIGALSNLLHLVGSKLKFTYKVKVEERKCKRCGKCRDVCPMWAITLSSGPRVNRLVCIACWECVTACPNKAVVYARG